MKISKNLVVIELNSDFVDAYRRKKRLRRHKLVRFAAVVILACYIYDCLEESFKKGL